MPAKLSYEYVYNYFKEHGCELLDTEYINSQTKMKYKCKNGHISEIIFNSFKQGNRCEQCSENKKYTYEFIYNFFKDNGCELLENEYINNYTKMKYVCNCGNKSYISFRSFKVGSRCKKCSGLEKLTFEYVYNYFKENGFELLETTYINHLTKMKYKCKNNHISKINFCNFKKGHRCKNCFHENNRGSNHSNWNIDRTRLKRSNYLSFDLTKINILSDDLNYNDYLINKSKYHIDHIFPRIAFIDNNLDNIYGEIIIKNICNLRENLRIINKKDNSSKAGKYNQEEFMKWISDKI